MNEFILISPEKKINEFDICALEKSTGFKLPPSFSRLYLKFNGGSPNKSWVITNDEYEPMQIADFKFIHPEGSEGENETRFIVGCYRLMCDRQIIPHTLLPFAVDDGGNFFCLDMLNGSVMFYAVDTFREDVSMAANQIAAQRLIAKSFEEFIESLEEESDF
jgi:hypothetical protein